MEDNAVKKNLVEYIRSHLAEQELTISEKSLQYTAERYAAMIMSNPKLNARKLVEEDIGNLKKILEQIKSAD